MSAHGIETRAQSVTLAEILGLGYAQAHRILQGRADWTFSNIEKVAKHFNVSVAKFSGPEIAQRAEDTQGQRHNAELAVGDKTLPCIVWVGNEVLSTSHLSHVAIRSKGKWVVTEPNALTADMQAYKVERLEVALAAAPRRTVAVLDDHEDIADTLTEYLHDAGFTAQAFYDAPSLKEALRVRNFDAYVLDWIVGAETAESVIRQIRTEMNSNAPIILITGKIDDAEDSIARMMVAFGIGVYVKPARYRLIEACLHQALEPRPAL
jgi:CheY-like chemotaxis protein